MPTYRVRSTYTPRGRRHTPVIESRAFDAATDEEALSVARMLNGYRDDSTLESAVVTDEAGRIVWTDLVDPRRFASGRADPGPRPAPTRPADGGAANASPSGVSRTPS